MTAKGGQQYRSLRAYLEQHINDQWTMLGGNFAGQERTAPGLLAESQKIALMTTAGISLSEDSLDHPVVERDGTVFIPEGTIILGMTLPFDMPLMTRSFVR